MRTNIIRLCLLLMVILLTITLSSSIACKGSSATSEEPKANVNQSDSTKPAATEPSSTNTTSTISPGSGAKVVDVVVAGYYNHGPLQPTVQAIKQVTSKYGDKVAITWIDLSTKEGEDYFKEHGLSAHMNIIINGKYEYNVNGKDVIFQWFEGQQWTKTDLDTVLSNLVSK